jgi:hypothetical protein
MVLLDLQAPDGSGRAARHAYTGRSSIEHTTIVLRKHKYRLIGIGPFTCKTIAGALGRRALRVTKSSSYGAWLGAEPSNAGSSFVG